MVEGKVVLVTGAGGGIGRDIALAMARHGARVVVNDIGAAVDGAGHSAGPAQQVVDEIHALGGEAVPNTDSVADAAAAARMVQCAVDNFGRIDAVVNNAGILRDRFFHKMSVGMAPIMRLQAKGAMQLERTLNFSMSSAIDFDSAAMPSLAAA